MAHYAFINDENEVVDVITGVDESETLPIGFDSWEEYYQSKRLNLICKRTSYNTKGNTHLLGGTAFRGNYASVGGKYDADNDVFIEADPSTSEISYTLNTTTWLWEKD